MHSNSFQSVRKIAYERPSLTNAEQCASLSRACYRRGRIDPVAACAQDREFGAWPPLTAPDIIQQRQWLEAALHDEQVTGISRPQTVISE